MNIIYIIAIIIVLIIFIIIYYLLNKQSSNIYNRETINLLWTGGYDSTFRLCQLLIIQKRKVQPYYISDIIDNKYEKHNERRHSTNIELKVMKKITELLYNTYPYIRSLLLPLINIKSIHIDEDIQENLNILYEQGRVRRPICQYRAIAQLSKDLNKYNNNPLYLEMSVEKEPQTSIMYRAIHDKVIKQNDVYYLKTTLNDEDNALYIYKYITFPTLDYTKRDMLNISKKYNFNNILELTWSCWYPVNGKPCNRCIMCRERII